MVITCAQIMKEKLVTDFTDFKPEVKDLKFFEDDFDFVVEGGDDKDSDDEDEDMDDGIEMSSEEDGGESSYDDMEE